MALRDLHHAHWARPAFALGGMLGLVGLAACSGGQAKDAANAQTASVAAAAPAATATGADPAATDGAKIYQRCATCHQLTGKGMTGAFPPLAGSEWATAKEVGVPIRVVLHGLTGPITVERQHYNSAMPPYGTNQPLDDSAVAAVLTYVRSSWGNAAGAVTPEQVAAQRAATTSRKTPWTAQELEPLLR